MTGPTPTEPVKTTSVAPEAPVDELSTEDSSDAQLRLWAKENGIEDVPGSGRLSTLWREQITNAMAAALDPKVEGFAKATSSTSSEPENVLPPEVEYRNVYQPPNTWVSGQTYTT